MMTVPVTAGVKMRRSSARRDASRNWMSDEMTIKVAIVAGPPTASAPMQTAMNAPDVPMNRMCPDPIRPTRTACRIVETPLTSSAANTAHAVYSGGCPAI